MNECGEGVRAVHAPRRAGEGCCASVERVTVFCFVFFRQLCSSGEFRKGALSKNFFGVGQDRALLFSGLECWRFVVLRVIFELGVFFAALEIRSRPLSLSGFLGL